MSNFITDLAEKSGVSTEKYLSDLRARRIIKLAISRALDAAANWVQETEGDDVHDDFRDDFDLPRKR